jgi:tRNA 5-methylaminomethyl-2-thiouridine biosynthesis bifunctional protein
MVMQEIRSEVWPGVRKPCTRPSSALVIGAGIAGASVARQLAERGVRVTVIERAQPASGGSGNPLAVVRAEPGAESSPLTQLTTAGILWLMRWMALYADHVEHDWCGVLRMTRDSRRHEKLLELAQTSDSNWLQAMSPIEAELACGSPPLEAAFHLPQAGWVVPTQLVMALLDHPLIQLRVAEEAVATESLPQAWSVRFADDSLAQAEVLVLATAAATALSPIHITTGSARGQLSHLAARPDRPLSKIVCRDGYITPAVNGWHTVGATVKHDDPCAEARRTDDEQNFQRLERLLPGFASTPEALHSGRVAWRATTPDRLPLVGKIIPGLYATLGHGARGITCAPLCGEWLAALICDQPLPLDEIWRERFSPLRFQTNQDSLEKA